MPRFSIVTSTPVLPSLRFASGADCVAFGASCSRGGGLRRAQRRGRGQRPGTGPQEAAAVDLSAQLPTLILHGILLCLCRLDRRCDVPGLLFHKNETLKLP